MKLSIIYHLWNQCYQTEAAVQADGKISIQKVLFNLKYFFI